MNAWLITWEGDIPPEQKIVAILGSRLSDRSVASFIEFEYMRATATAKDMANIANKPHYRPYKAQCSELINSVPHGDRVKCGDYPSIRARKVSSLKVVSITQDGTEIISWKEPPTFRWKAGSRTEVERASEGRENSITRPISPISRELDDA